MGNIIPRNNLLVLQDLPGLVDKRELPREPPKASISLIFPLQLIMKTITIILFILILFTSCTSVNKNNIVVRAEISKCEDIFNKAAKKEKYKLHHRVEEGAKKMTSYTLTGVGYTGDSIVFLTAGILIPAAICSPFYVSAGSNAGENLISKCWSAIGEVAFKGLGKSFGKLFGKKIYKKTEKLRCPKVDWLIKAINETAQCYKDMGRDDLYQQQLNVLDKNKLIARCK